MPVCAACGMRVEVGDAYCGECGAAVTAVPVAVVDRPPSSANGVGPPRVRPPYDRHIEKLDPISSQFGPAATRQAFVMALLAGFASLVLLVFGQVVGLDGSTTKGMVLLVGAVAFAAFLLLRVPVSLSEWKVLAEDKAELADEVFDHVAHSLARRRTPADSISVLHRYDVAKAMREAVHAATTEAVDRAYSEQPFAPRPDGLPCGAPRRASAAFCPKCGATHRDAV